MLASHLSVFLIFGAVSLFVLLIGLRQHLGQTLSDPAYHSSPGRKTELNLPLKNIFSIKYSLIMNHTLPFSILS